MEVFERRVRWLKEKPERRPRKRENGMLRDENWLDLEFRGVVWTWEPLRDIAMRDA